MNANKPWADHARTQEEPMKNPELFLTTAMLVWQAFELALSCKSLLCNLLEALLELRLHLRVASGECDEMIGPDGTVTDLLIAF